MGFKHKTPPIYTLQIADGAFEEIKLRVHQAKSCGETGGLTTHIDTHSNIKDNSLRAALNEMILICRCRGKVKMSGDTKIPNVISSDSVSSSNMNDTFPTACLIDCGAG